MNPILPFRQIHLDFHTSPLIPDVGADFDAEEFVRTLKEAAVNSITVFAKCHHGMYYYDTKIGPKHPSLKIDLLGEMVEACKAAGIRIPVYTTIVWDEWTAAHHPEWRQVSPEGRLVGAGPLDAGWRWLCMNTPYVDLFESHVAEVATHYPMDGFFFDITMQSECVCAYCLKSMAEQGWDPTSAEDRQGHALHVARNFMERITARVRKINPDLHTFFNGRVRIGAFREELPYFSHVEIESLPTGGWGYAHFPLLARYCRTLGKPFLGHTGRFHKSWGDFGALHNQAALEYECFLMMAIGGQCEIGDQLHPRGRLDRATYDLIGNVYRQVAAKEKWCVDARPVAEIGVVVPPTGLGRTNEVADGAVRMLRELRHQFDVLDAQSDLSPYKLVILPDEVRMDADFAAKVQAYLENGGGLILSHTSGLRAHEDTFALELGIRYQGKSPYAQEYIRVLDPIASGVPDLEHFLYDQGSMIETDAEVEVLARLCHPYFDRSYEHFCSHRQTPVDKESDLLAIVRSGRIIYLTAPLFGAYARHGYVVYRQIVGNCLDLLLPTPLVRVSGPSFLQAYVLRREGESVLHLLSYVPERRAPNLDVIEDRIALHDIKVAFRADQVVKRVYLAPQGTDLVFGMADEVVQCTVPVLDGHQMVVFAE